MANITVLEPIHTMADFAYLIPDYPYGGYRTQKRVWIETHTPKTGSPKYRIMEQTLNPKTGTWNKPHADTYNEAIVLYIDHNERDFLKWATLSEYDADKSREFLSMYKTGMSESMLKNVYRLAAYYQAYKELGKMGTPVFYLRIQDILTEWGHPEYGFLK